MINETHAPTLRSWVASANAAGADFPIQNLPYGIFTTDDDGAKRIGVAIGDSILDLAAVLARGALQFDAATAAALDTDSLNALMALPAAARSQLRLRLSRALREASPDEHALQACLVSQAQARLHLPARIGDYTDFFTSIHHATAVGKLFRPDNPLLPNYPYVPIAYHGRASSVRVSGIDFRRPVGQTAPGTGHQTPHFGPSRRLDYELELAIWVGPGNALGEPIAMAQAEDHVFGVGLFNDWSARDIQSWEYQPLGPFLAKNFASTVSPWVVTLEALAPFRVPFSRAAGEPAPLAYLSDDALLNRGAIDIRLEVSLSTAAMRDAGLAAQRLSTSNFRDAYWTIAQMVAHHSVGGCDLNPGDLFGSGTQSGPTAAEAGSMLELSLGGKQPIDLVNGESRTFLEDGDEITLSGYCEGPGATRIGLGTCTARVLPARAC
jgi:fumarylacetoacetase